MIQTCHRIRVGLVGLLAWGLAGCGANITPDTTLSELFDQITVGDVVAAFQQFTQSGGQLPSDQQAQLESLQRQLRNGQITDGQFSAAVQDSFPGGADRAFFPAGPFGGPPETRPNPLNLTDEQRQALRDILDRLRMDIHQLREDAHNQILSVLTDEQRAKLEEIRARLGQLGTPPDSADLQDSGLTDNVDVGTPADEGGRRPGRPGLIRGPFRNPPRPRPVLFLERLADELGLTQDQLDAIGAIRADLRDAVRARHEQARDEFRSILTEDQLATLDQGQSGG